MAIVTARSGLSALVLAGVWLGHQFHRSGLAPFQS